ncbi:uncharacterized protein LOC129942125 [Eupeodes corollae]|uniref:uncharacterized protein LOC129942125 n=1 Tax=Eupeodes corollae TaxID=290404 RepID=UPI0024913E21|nr:uncharacterized protein LOC129942125 [Eupeodes corollae]
MSALKDKLTNLTDIPLGLQQGDINSPEINAEKTDKIKSNSLKRFFRTAKSSLTPSTNVDNAAIESEVKNVRSLQLRFGSFDKKDDKEKLSKTHSEPSSSSDASRLTISENRSKLQTRIANYWTATFKKSSKQASTNKNAPTGENTLSTGDVDVLQNNQSTNL